MAHTRSVSESVTVDAPPAAVFDLLADPRRHQEIDGSSSLQGIVEGPPRLALGSTFGMKMRLGLPYKVTNTVAEFEPDRLIAWHHFAKARWRYELAPAPGGGTVVTESFDWSQARGARAIELLGFPRRNLASIRATLAGLQTRFRSS